METGANGQYPRGPHAEQRGALQSALAARIQQYEESRDNTVILQPRAVKQAREFTEILADDDGDMQSRIILGWFYWYRSQISSSGSRKEDMYNATAMLVSAFTVAEPKLLSLGLPAIVRPAHSLILNVLETPEPRLVTKTIELWRHITAATPPGESERATRFAALGGVLEARFKQTETPADLDEMITAFRLAADAIPPDESGRAGYLLLLAGPLLNRFERSKVPADLEDAVTSLQEAVEVTPLGDPERNNRLTMFSAALRMRFDQTGIQDDLETAISIQRDLVDSTSAAHPDRAEWLESLAESLAVRFERSGELRDLDEAVLSGQAALDATTAGDPERPHRLTNLGAALVRRSDWTGGITDLDSAVRISEQALRVTRRTQPEYVERLANLGIALYARFRQTRAQADLDESIRRLSQAVRAAPVDEARHASMQASLGAALRAKAEQTGSKADLNRAVHLEREALDAVPQGHPDRALRLTGLAVSLLAQFEMDGRLPLLEEAVNLGREAVGAGFVDRSQQAVIKTNLAKFLEARYRRTGAQADLNEAITILDQVSLDEAAAASVRVRAAHVAGCYVAESQPERAVGLLERAVRLLPEVAPRQLGRSDKQHAVGQFVFLAGDAAALALNDPTRPMSEKASLAAQLLEGGRAILLNQAMQIRTDLAALAAKHPNLAARFVHLRDLLDYSSEGDTLGKIHREAATNISITSERPDQSRDFREILNQIRAQPGFASFALPATVQELKSQASAGPIVTFNVNRYRSDALVITQEDIECVPLPGLTIEKVFRNLELLAHILSVLSEKRSSKEERTKAEVELTGLLRWLWDDATGPVLEELEYKQQSSSPSQSWPRVWWVPGGLLGYLPIHAAGYHVAAGDLDGCTVIDRVISSYSPTVAALRFARRKRPDADTAMLRRALLVGMPTTPGIRGRLRYVAEEVAQVAALLPDSIALMEPSSTSIYSAGLPTRAAVLEWLPKCAIAHFSCHGESDINDPSASRLLLKDHKKNPLTVAVLDTIQLDHAQLAYLSACSTTQAITANLVNEAVHLTSAFQLVGYSHVIGTLWEVDDKISARLSTIFYKRLLDSGGIPDVTRAPYALHYAIRAVRDRIPAMPSRWAAYLHAGE
jgi:tetratricopeptide (TPR) repeat protein